MGVRAASWSEDARLSWPTPTIRLLEATVIDKALDLAWEAGWKVTIFNFNLMRRALREIDYRRAQLHDKVCPCRVDL